MSSLVITFCSTPQLFDTNNMKFTIFIIIVLYLNSIYSVPVVYKEVQLLPITRHRPLFKPTWVKIQISDILDDSGIFPIQFSVPNTISAIFNGIANVASTIGQRIPVIQGYFRPEEPRKPLKNNEQYVYFIPAEDGVSNDQKMALVPVFKQKVTLIDIPEAGEDKRGMNNDIKNNE